VIPSRRALDPVADFEDGGREGGEGGEIVEINLGPVPEGDCQVSILLRVPFHSRNGLAWLQREQGRVLLLLPLILLLL